MTSLNKQMPQIVNPGGRLRAGCYAVRFSPEPPYADEPHVACYEGTIRVEHRTAKGETVPVEGPPQDGAYVRISGDLYAHKSPWEEAPPLDIPIFPRDRYRFYLCALGIDATKANRFALRLQSHSLNDRRWKNEGEFTAAMEWTDAPPGYPSRFDYLEGEVRDSNGHIGTLTMAWVSPYLRRAIVEIDTVEGVPPPRNNQLDRAQYADWESVFKQVGWEVRDELSDRTIEEPVGVEWSEAELFKAAMTLRDSSLLDRQWRYYILCVRLLEDLGRAYTFDSRGTDARESFFETVVIGAGYKFHPGYVVRDWGSFTKSSLSDTPGYFRSAVHEIGHAMNLDHNFSDNGFMNTTDTIAASAREGEGFPENICWHFAPEDRERLRHWPDIVVRPGSPIHSGNLPELAAAIYPDASFETPQTSNSHNFEFSISPLIEQVPIGAPVRIKLRLVNQHSKDQLAPVLSLKSGHLSGHVINADGNSRDFWPASHPEDEMKLSNMKPREVVSDSITLLRGAGGPLFPTPGEHRVVVDLVWRAHGRDVALRAETKVTVTPPRDRAHYVAAQRLLQSKDSLINLVIAGDYVGDDNQAINAALHNEVLGPHLAIIRLKYLIRGRFRGGPEKVIEILSRKLNRELFLGESEIRSLWKLISLGAPKNGNQPPRSERSKDPQQLRILQQLKRFQQDKLDDLAELLLSTPKEKIQRLVALFKGAHIKHDEIASLAEAIKGAVANEKAKRLNKLFLAIGIGSTASRPWDTFPQEVLSESQINHLQHVYDRHPEKRADNKKIIQGFVNLMKKSANGGNGGQQVMSGEPY